MDLTEIDRLSDAIRKVRANPAPPVDQHLTEGTGND